MRLPIRDREDAYTFFLALAALAYAYSELRPMADGLVVALSVP